VHGNSGKCNGALRDGEITNIINGTAAIMKSAQAAAAT
jgi:hypothetical protein